jgi:peptidoglycan/LPS O-acetylase OafA/YrhL
MAAEFDRVDRQSAPGGAAGGTKSTRGGVALRLPYLPGLDGLRAIAVGAVLLYHAGVSWLPGGFLGVEVFFVISGYLITALLLAEWHQQGRLDLRTFWIRRARRLLPALYLLLIAVLAFAVIRLPDEVARLRGDALAAFGYVTNWYFIFRQQSYFEVIGRPSLFQHLWSLAIEEQFYVIWPPILALLLRRWSQRRLLIVLLGTAVASSLLMAILYRPGVDPSRVYYGTDTRAAGLLLGGALAVAWAPWRTLGRATQQTIAWLDRAGVGAIVLLILLFIRLDQSQTFLYRGGFALIALATATAIAGTVAPGARLLPALLDSRPMRWIGERSYSLYLWHWPLFAVTRPEIDTRLGGLPLLLLRLGLALVLADISYRWFETPIRRGALGRLWGRYRTLADARDRRSWQLVQRWSIGGGAVLGMFLALAITVAAAKPPSTEAEFGTGSIERGAAAQAAEPTPTEPAIATNATGGAQAIEIPPAAPPPCPLQVSKPQITAVGDSVLVAGAEKMEEYIGEGLYISASIGRQAVQVPTILRERRLAGTLGSIVIVQIGANGYVTNEDFNDIMAELQGVRAVIFINVRVPKEWERANNTTLATGAKRYPNAVVLDWYGLSAGHPEYLKDDGVHPYQVGREVYAKMILNEINARKAAWATADGCTLGSVVPAAARIGSRETSRGHRGKTERRPSAPPHRSDGANWSRSPIAFVT